MQIVDLIIIYFSCGAPFAVYYLTQSQTRGPGWSTAGLIGQLSGRLLLWPYYGILIILRRIAGGGHPDRQFEAAVSEIQARMEAIAHSKNSVSLFQFRETVDRYAGLTISIAAGSTAKPNQKLFDAAGHTAPDLAAVCLDRRNRERLKFHQACARNEFIDMAAGVTGGGTAGIEIMELAAELAMLLEDRVAFDEIERLRQPRSTELSAAADAVRDHKSTHARAA